MNWKLIASNDDTVRILRPPPKVYTDELGHNIWMSGVDPIALEVSGEAGKSTDPYNNGLASTADVWTATTRKTQPKDAHRSSQSIQN